MIAALVVVQDRRERRQEREINQTCASAGCFAGETPGFSVTITGRGSYVLTGDLTLTAAVGSEGSKSFASSAGLLPALTISTGWRRNSGGYGGRLFGITGSSFPSAEVSTKAGQLQSGLPDSVRSPSTVV